MDHLIKTKSTSQELQWQLTQYVALEQYFSRSLGIALITIAVLNILLTGSIPLTSSLADSESIAAQPNSFGEASLTHDTAVGEGATTDANDPKAPYALPTLTITTTYHSVIAFFCYTRYNTTGSMAFAIGSIGHASLAAVGLWCFLFATSSGRITRETLVDKRMSGWPLKNSEADKKRSPKSR